MTDSFCMCKGSSQGCYGLPGWDLSTSEAIKSNALMCVATCRACNVVAESIHLSKRTHSMTPAPSGKSSNG
jgi:hypothetical protein